MRHWPAILTAVAALAAAIPVAHHFAAAGDNPKRVEKPFSEVPTNPDAVSPNALSGIQINRMYMGRDEVTAPSVDGRMAHLTLDVDLQRAALQQMRKLGVPEGASLLMDLKTGRLLVYASKTASGPFKDIATSADAPAASVFKVITGATLVEKAGLKPDTSQCYRGGKHSVSESDLIADEKRDKWCATISEAMGRSLNTVFARLAAEHLTPDKLLSTAGALGFNYPLRFDLPVETSTLKIPDGQLEFARTSAGFWNSTLSPLHALVIASTVAQRGMMMRPVLVNSVTDSSNTPIYRAPVEPQYLRRAIRPETADAVREMMEATVSMGTAYNSFHDGAGRPFLPGIKVAGKTGTLTRDSTKQFYTWLVGFAPSDAPEVAFVTLVVNKEKWITKAPVVARELLRSYFASKGTPGVTAPQ